MSAAFLFAQNKKIRLRTALPAPAFFLAESAFPLSQICFCLFRLAAGLPLHSPASISEQPICRLRAAEKITDISIKTDTEIRSSYVSSVSGAILGAHFFGTAGAIIGGQPRERQTTIETHYLIVAYTKQGEPAYISFQIEDIKSAAAIISFFNNKSDAPNRIEL